MKNNLKYTSMLFTLALFTASTVQASAANNQPKQRTWSEWATQKATANNVFASRDSRALATAQLQLGTAEIQKARADAEFQRQQVKSQTQIKNIADAAAAQKRLSELNSGKAAQDAAIELEKQNRARIRAGQPLLVAAAPAQAVRASVAAAPAAQAARASVVAAPAAQAASQTPSSGTVVVGTTDEEITAKIGPNFAAYLSDKSQRAFALAEVTANAAAKGQRAPTPKDVGGLKTAFFNAISHRQSVNVPAAYVK